ncbi:MAG: DUF4974 domain-containing protein [Bacteroidales bacterium]|nr:DUF4974 domain-containing protein [Bacteroidales bacterium]
MLSEKEVDTLYAYVMDERNKDEIMAWLKRQWDASPQQAENVPSEALFVAIKKEIEMTAGKRQRIPHRRILKWNTVLRYAAVFAAAFGVSRLIPANVEQTPAPLAAQETSGYNEVLVPYGSKTVVVLPDSTRVRLNAGARLKYPAHFSGDTREVFLQGEGFFDVAKDTERPFFVNTNGMHVKVLGTKFNLMANADDNKIEATLMEGSIEVLGLKDDQTSSNLILKPGQKITLQKEQEEYRIVDSAADDVLLIPKEIDGKVKITSASLTEKNTELSIAWTQDKLIFVKERFEDVKTKIERWYGVRIEVTDTEILNYRFTGTFDKQTLEQAMMAFGKAASCNFKINQNKVTVSKIKI